MEPKQGDGRDVMTINCPACKVDNKASSRFCSDCGSPLSMFTAPRTIVERGPSLEVVKSESSPRKLVVIVTLMTVGFGAIIALVVFGSTRQDPVIGNSSSTDYATCLIVTPASGSLGDSNTDGSNIEVSVRNTCGRSLIDVEVTYKLYDSSGNVVGAATGANHGGFDAGETMQLKAIADQPYYEHYRVSLIDGN